MLFKTNSTVMENSNNIQLVISKSAVVKKDFGKCKVVLQNLLLTRESVLNGKGKLTLRRRGYSTDKRKPHEIPQVVEYIKELDRMFSYWFFFCKPNDAGLQLLTSCLCKPGYTRKGVTYSDPDSLKDFVMKHFCYLTVIEVKCKIPKKVINEIEDKIDDYFLNYQIKDKMIHNKLKNPDRDYSFLNIPVKKFESPGIFICNVTLEKDIGCERLLVLYDENIYAQKLVMAEPFRFIYKPGVLKTKYGPVLFHLFYVDNPGNPAVPLFMTDRRTNPHNPDELRSWYELAMQTYIHLAVVNENGDILGFYELENVFFTEEEIDNLCIAAEKIKMIDYKKALEIYYDEYSLYDLFKV